MMFRFAGPRCALMLQYERGAAWAVQNLNLGHDTRPLSRLVYVLQYSYMYLEKRPGPSVLTSVGWGAS